MIDLDQVMSQDEISLLREFSGLMAMMVGEVGDFKSVE